MWYDDITSVSVSSACAISRIPYSGVILIHPDLGFWLLSLSWLILTRKLQNTHSIYWFGVWCCASATFPQWHILRALLFTDLQKGLSLLQPSQRSSTEEKIRFMSQKYNAVGITWYLCSFGRCLFELFSSAVILLLSTTVAATTDV